MCLGARKGQKKVWALGTEPSSVRAQSAGNVWAIVLATTFYSSSLDTVLIYSKNQTKSKSQWLRQDFNRRFLEQSHACCLWHPVFTRVLQHLEKSWSERDMGLLHSPGCPQPLDPATSVSQVSQECVYTSVKIGIYQGAEVFQNWFSAVLWKSFRHWALWEVT